MKTTKIMILSVTVLLILSMILFITQLLLRKLKNNSVEKTATLASGTWFITLFLSGTFLTGRAVSVFAEAIDNIFKINPTDALLNIFKTGSLLTGLTIVWLLIWYFLSNTLSVTITGKKNPLFEAEANNYTYFLIRGTILTGFIICLLPAFELILRAFIPNIEIPFYH